MMNDLYIAFVYLPPLTSSYCKVHSKNIMSKLEKQIEYFSCKGKVMLCGDFNARIGSNIDLVEKEEEHHLPLPKNDIFETIFPRVSCDKSYVNQTGRWLIEQCVDNQLFVLNVRTLGDLTGRFTCHTPKGSSTVDYIIASRTLLNCIHSVRVHDLSIFSDHCMVSTRIKLFHESSCNYEEANIKDSGLSLINAPDRFEWWKCQKLIISKLLHVK